MCGIAGILRVYPPGATPPPHFESIPEAWLDLLDDSIKHRGPDGQGRFRDRAVRSDGCTVDVALIHRRLSILDHKGGAQPMVSSPRSPSGLPEGVAGLSAGGGTSAIDCRFPLLFQGSPTDAVRYEPIAGCTDNLLAVTFNGCIYNHRELRKELEAKGHRFVTDHSDTEVLLHGWREWRFDLLDRLEGMHATALWDRHAGDVALMNDPFSEKPLHRASWGNDDDVRTYSWSSSCAGVVRLMAVCSPDSGRIEPRSTSGWIQFGWNLPLPYQDTIPVLPGFAQWEHSDRADDRSTPSSKSVVAAMHEPSNSPLDAESVDKHLRLAVHARLEAEVPIGIFLSGGIDSGLIAKYAAERRPDISAYTMRMPHPDYDESEAAAQTARALGIRHEILDCQSDAANDLVAAIEQMGLPFGDSSLLPTMWLCRAAKQRITVALGGDGGDELFLGYERHVIARILAQIGRLDNSVFKAIVERIEVSPNPKSRRTKFARLMHAAAGRGYKDLLAIFPPHLAQRLHGKLWDKLETREYHHGWVPPVGEGISFDTHFRWARRLDTAFYLPFDLLRKSDTASMAVGLELRSPMLDSTLARLAINASRQSLMPRGQRKGLLRAVARQYLPKEIVDRPKMGFAIPVGEWFRTDFGQMKTLLFDMLHSADPFPADLLGLELNRSFIDQMVSEHMESRRDHSQRLYMLLVLAIWCRWLRRIRAGGSASVPGNRA